MNTSLYATTAARSYRPISTPGAYGPVSTFNGAIKVIGNQLVDGAGNTLFMRGANYSGYEFAYATGALGYTDASGFQAGQANGPKLSAMASNWGMGIIRIPVNAGSWFGGVYYDINGNTVNMDPNNNYKTQVIAQVNAAVTAGFYVIFDLHWINIGKVAPVGGQVTFPDIVNGPAFWTDAANTFKNNPAVIFELFNEPIFYDWPSLRDGSIVPAFVAQQNGQGTGPVYDGDVFLYPITITSGTFTAGELFTSTPTGGRVVYVDTTVSPNIAYLVTSNASVVTMPTLPTGTVITGSTSHATATTTGASTVHYAGYQVLLNAVRATGATNVCLIGGCYFSADLSGWLGAAPIDPAPAGFVGTWTPQIGAVWHAYPDYSGPTYGNTGYGEPSFGAVSFTYAQGIMAGGYPLVITETGGSTNLGGGPATANNEPFCSNMATWCTTYNVTTTFWAWDIWAVPANACITDVNGTPTVGQGQVQKAWCNTYTTRYGT